MAAATWDAHALAVAAEAARRSRQPGAEPQLPYSKEAFVAADAQARATDPEALWLEFATHLAAEEPTAEVARLWELIEALAPLRAVPAVREASPALRALERVVVALLGHPSLAARTQAVAMMAVLQDGHSWQREQPFKSPTVVVVGDRFVLPASGTGRVEVCAPTFDLTSCDDALLTAHDSCDDFGTFPRCGFYDWRLEDGTMGRFVAVAPGAREENMHEVVVDMLDESGRGRGAFVDATNRMEGWADAGISSLLLFGALERDNGPNFSRPDAMASALTCRRTPNRMLGGAAKFTELLAEAQQLGVRVLVNMGASVAAAGLHRRYRPLMCYTLDTDGHRHIHRGSDGLHNQWEDQVLLNMRKLDSWQALRDDALAVAGQGVGGIYFEQAQSFPLIMEADVDELGRLDPDGERHYSAEEVLEGATVRANQEAAYWPTPAASRYANPLLAYLARAVWRRFPQLAVVGQAHSGRARSLLLSGVVPRVASPLAAAIARINGHRVTTNGEVSLFQPTGQLVRGLYTWLDEQLRTLPPGGIEVQIKGICSETLPYPALLYGRGAWPAVDLLYLLPGVPMTFGGEDTGRTHRVDFAKMYRHNVEWLEEDLVRRTNEANSRASMGTILLQVVDNEDDEGGGRDKSAEQEAEEEETLYLTDRDAGAESIRKVNSWSSLAAPSQQNRRKASVPKIRSLLTLTDADDLSELEAETARDLGPQYGFDLSRIRAHYEHRAALRAQHRVFRDGDVRTVAAHHRHGAHPRVFAFARWLPQQVVLTAVNFSDSPSTFYLDKTPLAALFGGQDAADTTLDELQGIWEARDLFRPEAPPVYYSPYEVTFSQQYRTLPSNASRCMSYTWVPVATPEEHDEAQRRICYSALERLSEAFAVTDKNLDLAGEISREPRIPDSELEDSIVYNYAYARVKAAVARGAADHSVGAAGLCGALAPLGSVSEAHTRVLRQSIFLAARFAQPAVPDHVVLGWLREGAAGLNQELCGDIVQSNTLGSLVFIAPELGKWSTVGGLGVMVDELTQGLALLGTDVTVISPYYNENRKGHTNYLAADNIHWRFNLFLKMGASETLEVGVHVGRVKGVRVVFLHHAETFSRPYPSGDAAFQVRLMVLVAKGSLEALCQLRTIPSLIITNDWFSGLVAGCARSGAFGDAFSSTSFFHIVHNLDPSYEGRLYPEHQGDLTGLHALPRDLLVDPFDTGPSLILNPSRAALLASHVWGTVSRSYRDDLKQSSPLAPLLSRTPHPFGFPNGVPVLARRTRLANLKHNTHELAKAHLQRTYFGFAEPDLSIPLLSFVGRITKQKGVHLILGAVEELIAAHSGRILFLVGGPASASDTYGNECAGMIRHLRARYPSQFWGDPELFFADGPCVNLGSDFGLMPSLFEPGGIVQQEFFSASTPVIAHSTGGLKDTVIEFDPATRQGSGFTFEAHTVADLMHAIHRAMTVFKSPELYAALRESAAASVMDLSVVSWAWLREFSRVRRCLVDEPLTVLRFAVSPARRPAVVMVAGSFTDWEPTIAAEFDPVNDEWVARLRLGPGDHHYKFKVDGEWTLSPGYPTHINEMGAVNNCVTVVSADLQLAT